MCHCEYASSLCRLRVGTMPILLLILVIGFAELGILLIWAFVRGDLAMDGPDTRHISSLSTAWRP